MIIRAANVRDLLLNKEVVDALRGGCFHVLAVRTVDENIELFTGVPAGRRKADGTFREGTVHGWVARRLLSYAARLQTFGLSGDGDGAAAGGR